MSAARTRRSGSPGPRPSARCRPHLRLRPPPRSHPRRRRRRVRRSATTSRRRRRGLGSGRVGRCGNSGGRGNECRGHRNGSSRCTGPLPASHPWLRTADRPEDRAPRISSRLRSRGLRMTVVAAKGLVGARLAAQMLSGPPARSAEDVVQRILAVQAQDARGARLAVRSRSLGSGLHAHDVDAGLSERRSLIVTWLHRGTLQLVGADDYWWLHPLTTPQVVVKNRTRLHQEGVSDAQAARGVEVIVDALRTHGAQTRASPPPARRGARPDEGPGTRPRVARRVGSGGDVVRGPMRGGEHAFVVASDWSGAGAGTTRARATCSLARRVQVTVRPTSAPSRNGPACRSATRAGRSRHRGPESSRVRTDSPILHIAGALPAFPKPRLLGPFDPLLHGWRRGTVHWSAPWHRDDERFVPPVRSSPGAPSPRGD